MGLDPAGCSHLPTRVLKYAKRGFGTLLLQHCGHSPRCDVSLLPETQKLMEAIHTVQHMPQEMFELIRDSLTFKRYHPQALLEGHVGADALDEVQQSFYGGFALFPGIPRGSKWSAPRLQAMVRRQLSQATAAGPHFVCVIPKLITSIEDLAEKVGTIVTARWIRVRHLSWIIVRVFKDFLGWSDVTTAYWLK